jgi:tetratricopeptide (TPR) repeat protein
MDRATSTMGEIPVGASARVNGLDAGGRLDVYRRSMALLAPPLPIAGLLRQARNAHDPTRRHLIAYYAWEASVRLTVAAFPPAERGALAMPSVGHFVAAMPERKDKLTDPELLALVGLLREIVEGRPTVPKHTTGATLLALLPGYRNRVFGHGSTRPTAFDERAAQVLLEALPVAWTRGLFWPSDADFVFVDRVEIDAEGARRAQMLNLLGPVSEREPPSAAHSVDEGVRPRQLYMRRAGRYRSLHPWLVFDASDVRERVLFFNGLRRRHAEFLDYLDGAHVKSTELPEDLTEAVRALLGAEAEASPSTREENAQPADQDAEEEPLERLSARNAGDGVTTQRSATLAKRARWPYLVGAAALALVAAVAFVATRDDTVETAATSGAASAAPLAPASPTPVVSADPDIQGAFERALTGYLHTDVDAAAAGFRDAARLAPEHPWPRLGLTLAYDLMGRFEEARASFEEALERSGNGSPRDQSLIAIVDRADREPVEALEAAWQAHRKSYGDDALSHHVVAYYLTHKGSRAERVARFDRALELAPHPVTHLAKAGLLLRVDRYDEAREAVEAGLAIRPTSAWLLTEKGLVALAQGDVATGKRSLIQAMELGGPIRADHAYAAVLTATEADEEERRRQVARLSATVNVDDRLSFLCHHGLALLRRGRAAEGDALLAELEKTAREAHKPGTAIRCESIAAWFDLVTGRTERAEARLTTLSRAVGSVRISQQDAKLARHLSTKLRGIVAARAGRLEEATHELAALRTDGGAAELSWHVALAGGTPVEPPTVDDDASLLHRLRQGWARARLLELRGDVAGARQSYEAMAALGDACVHLDRWADFPCGAFVAEALVRLAELDDDDGARRSRLARLDELWPRADETIAIVRRAAALRD